MNSMHNDDLKAKYSTPGLATVRKPTTVFVFFFFVKNLGIDALSYITRTLGLRIMRNLNAVL